MKKLQFLTLDCESSSLPFTNQLANDADEKRTLSIAMPLIYDIGWVIADREGNTIKEQQYLVAEIFSVPSIFNTAYYKEKRPIYLEKLAKGETVIKPWNEIMDILIADMNSVNAVGAYNSMFDFKKAIPFTELYIKKLYSADYERWESMEKRRAKGLLSGERKEKNENFDPTIFKFRGVEYPLYDLWGLSVDYLLNNVTYKKNCLNHNLLTNSGIFFKSSAEATYQYICDKYDFVEAHTALEDARIETQILAKIAKKHSITMGIEYFPFRNLGYTYDFVTRKKRKDKNEIFAVVEAMENYVEKSGSKCKSMNYLSYIENKIQMLKEILGIAPAA